MDSAKEKDFKLPERTKSSGAHVDPAKLGFLRNRNVTQSRSPPPAPGAAASTASPAPDPVPARPSLSPGPEETAAAPVAAPTTTTLPAGLKNYYPPRRFKELWPNNESPHLSSVLRVFGAKLWPEGTVRPDNAWSREGLFSDKERQSKDRKLSNIVLGVLGRITPENYDKMKMELTELPIRQSTDEEITEVVQMMYNKAVRPEDELYTELYARLMADLVQHTGVHNVGKTIRKAIIDKCQQQFEKPFVLSESELVDDAGNPLDQEEIDMKRQQLKARLRANIKFLGHLFLSGMVNEKVVNFVLFHLLYGPDAPKKRKPEEYELEMFCDLLKKVVKRLSPNTQRDYVPDYMKSLETLTPKVSNRIKFMLMDMKELYDNKWEARRRTHGNPGGPMKLDELEKRQAENTARESQAFDQAAIRARHGHPHSTVGTAGPTPKPATPQVPLPKLDEVYGVMEEYRTDGVPKPLEDFFRPIPAKKRPDYISHWLSRIVKVARYSDDRKRVGEVLEALEAHKLINAAECEKCVRDLVARIVVNQWYDELKNFWSWWAEIVYSSKRILNPNLHTFLLRALIRGGEMPTKVEEIVGMVIAVLRAPDPNAAHRETTTRFRPLLAVLSYMNREPDPDVKEEDLEEAEKDNGDDDLLARIIAEMNKLPDDIMEPEFALFDTLCNVVPATRVLEYVKRHDRRTEPLFAAKAVSAIFTYVRCDTTENQVQFLRLKEPLKEIAKSHAPVIISEAFFTWLELGKEPTASIERFLACLREHNVVKDEAFDAAAQMIGKYDATLESHFNQVRGVVPAETKLASPTRNTAFQAASRRRN